MQVKCEMVRRARVDGVPVAPAAAAFGFSRPSFYSAAEALDREGLGGLVPAKPGPRKASRDTSSPNTTPALPMETSATRRWTPSRSAAEELLWVSGVLPGRTVDITTARRFKIADKVLAFLGLLADLGYIGLHPQVITGYKRKRG